MQVYKALIAYDGTDYHGWQVQPHALTVAGMLEKRFKDVFKKDITLIGASRTDAGVHALGQVARFALDTDIPPEKMIKAWNNALPQDILIRSLDYAPENFHPQRNVHEKTYYYFFFNQRPLPFAARYGYYNGPFDHEKLVEALQVFVGTHDFRSFCTGYERENTVRTITGIDMRFFRRLGAYCIEVHGPGFLRHMIRRIVGASLEVASSRYKSVDILHVALASKNPHQHLFVAPANGLLLRDIRYTTSLF